MFSAALMLAAATAALAANADKAALADEGDARNWAAYGRTYNETHFSPLTEINRETVGQLRLAWTLDLDVGSAQSTPLAVEGILYVAAGYTVVHAVDGHTGKLLWRYDSEAAKLAGAKLRTGSGIRGLAYLKGRLFVGTQDGRLLALDAKTGTVVWNTPVLDAADRSFISGAPRVCGSQVIIGFGAGGGDAVRGHVSAYDVATGKQVWRFYTVPEGRAGGSVWNAIVCDGDRVYAGVGESRGGAAGDGSYAASIVALKLADGNLLWQHKDDAGGAATADAGLDITIATVNVDGAPRRVLLQAPKDGWFYVIDRASGQRLTAKKLDPGVHNHAAQAFSPKSGLIYVPTTQVTAPAPGEVATADAGRSFLVAWDPAKQRSQWAVPTPGPYGGGALATAGDVVFQGQADGYITGYSAVEGRRIWAFYAATAALGAPISFAVGKKQYIAILVGPPAGVAANQGPMSAKFGWDSRLHPRRLLAFTLGGEGKLPPTPSPTPAKALDGPDVTVDDALAKQGAESYAACQWCHGAGAEAGGMAPDLRASVVPLNAAQFSLLVRAGVEARGMPKFTELNDHDLDALRAYIRARARRETRPGGVAPPPPETAPPARPAGETPAEEKLPPGSLQSEGTPPKE